MYFAKKTKTWKKENFSFNEDQLISWSYHYCILRSINGVLFFNVTSYGSVGMNNNQVWVKEKLDSMGLNYIAIDHYRGSLTGPESLDYIAKLYGELLKTDLSDSDRTNRLMAIELLKLVARGA